MGSRVAKVAGWAATIFGELLITLGVLTLLFAGWQLFWTDVEANADVDRVNEQLFAEWTGEPGLFGVDGPTGGAGVGADAGEGAGGVDEDSATISTPTPENDADPVGNRPLRAFARLHVPRFGEKWTPRPIMETASVASLKKSVGHYRRTQMPGEVGNFAIAGHRTTYGRPFHNIDRLQPGDPVVVETRDEWFVYRVRDIHIVAPSDVWVVGENPNQPGAPAEVPLLTMTACHPKYSAKERIVAHAILDERLSKADGVPHVLRR